MENSTERFLRRLQEQNIAIAAEEAQKKEPTDQVDPIRVQRQQERHDKYGTLRAREKPGNRPRKTTRVLPHIDLS